MSGGMQSGRPQLSQRASLLFRIFIACRCLVVLALVPRARMIDGPTRPTGDGYRARSTRARERGAGRGTEVPKPARSNSRVDPLPQLSMALEPTEGPSRIGNRFRSRVSVETEPFAMVGRTPRLSLPR